MSSSSVERTGSFEQVRHRESVDSVVEDASPTSAHKKHPWKRDTPVKKKMRAPRRLKTEETSHRVIDDDHVVNGSSLTSSSIVKGTWASKTLVDDEQQDDGGSDYDESNEAITKSQSSDGNEGALTPGSSLEIRRESSEESNGNHNTQPPDRIKTAESQKPLTADVTAELTVSLDTESSRISESPKSKKSPDSVKSSASKTQVFRESRDETLDHLVQMVASNEMTEMGGHVPFMDPESKGSLSEYSAAGDAAMNQFQSASSGYSAEYEDTDASQVTFFQSATLSSGSGTFPVLECDTGNRGTPLQQSTVAYSSELMANFTGGDASEVASRNFTMEHRIFMKAALELLTQRERYAADVDMNEKDTIKSGPLKKASHLVRGIWKVKYVEVRRGVFSYYEDESKDSEVGALVRKNIPLHASTCSCRAVKIQHKALSVNPGGAIFELKTAGNSKRLWMANSREERQAWIEAINTATLGRSVTRGESDVAHDTGKSGTVSDESPYKVDLETYISIQREVALASSREQYAGALSVLIGKKLNVPVQWIRRQMGGVEHANRAFHEETVSTGVDQLWKDLLRDSVRIDDELFVGGNVNSPDKIIAALMRCIMAFDRTSPLSENAADSQKNKYYISESQSLSYARDILLCGNRTRSGGDSYYCVNTLCKNPHQVVVVPSGLEAEPWQINLSHIQPEKRGPGDTYYSLNLLSGWLKTRSKPQKKWKRRYFVLSEGTLSYFEKALPRPRGLRGQVGVVESTISVSRVLKSDSRRRSSSSDADDIPSEGNFVVSIIGSDGKLDRQILFEDEKKFILWTHSLEAYCVDDELWQSRHSINFVTNVFRALREELIGSQDLYGNFVLGHKSLKNNADELGLDSEQVNICIANASKSGANGRATVLVSIEAATDYKVCTLDPQGDEKEDTWA